MPLAITVKPTGLSTIEREGFRGTEANKAKDAAAYPFVCLNTYSKHFAFLLFNRVVEPLLLELLGIFVHSVTYYRFIRTHSHKKNSHIKDFFTCEPIRIHTSSPMSTREILSSPNRKHHKTYSCTGNIRNYRTIQNKHTIR
ncbi:hypothetical protein GQX74_004931 [Glossina fuscipes]|nr:hypothetical protein GQX74_004931 [Glossina fuscipes]